MTWSGLLRRAVVVTLMLAVGCTPSAHRDGPEQRAVAAAFAAVTSSYQAEMERVQQRGRDALAAGDREAILDVYRAFRDTTAAMHDEFAALDAPSGIRAQHATLLENLTGQRAVLEGIVNAASAGDDAQLTQGLGELTSLLASFATIHTAIDRELADGG